MKYRNLIYTGIFLAAIFVSFAPVQAQLDPCAGDRVGIRSGTGTVEIQRRDCEMILLSYDNYFALEVASRQNDSLRSKSLRYINVVESNISLRDSIHALQKDFIGTQDTTILRYQRLVADYEKAANDALDNAKFAERRLRIAKLKTSIFAIGGGIVGILGGLLVGKSLAN